MAPKIRYDAAEMQTKADESAEKEIQNVTREGIELSRSAEVTCEYLGILKDDGFKLDARPTLRSTVGYKWSYRDKTVDVTETIRGSLRLLCRARYQSARAMENRHEMQSASTHRPGERRTIRRPVWST